MCVVVYKPVGVNFPSMDILKNCFDRNRDGAGFMYADGDMVHIHKGYMSWNEFEHAIKPYTENKDLPFVMHFRIATHGGINQAMTHPFPLAKSTKKLGKLDIDTAVGIAHNGIIPMCDGTDKLSDTAQFVKEYMTLLINNPQYYKNPKLCDIIEELICSKMCILSNDMHAEILGKGWSIVDDVYYSNDSYLGYSYKKNQAHQVFYDTPYRSWYDTYTEEYSDVVCEMCGKPITDNSWKMIDNVLMCSECEEIWQDCGMPDMTACLFAQTKDFDSCYKCNLDDCIYWGTV